MRVLAVLAALGLATPALAQLPPPAPNTPQYAEMLAQQEAARQQMVQLQNQLSSLEAQIRTQQNLAAVQAATAAPRLPPPDGSPGHALPKLDSSQLASIPDSALADSNKKVLDAAANRR